ncbi:hypothetical protein GCM10011504_16600 [Siccirubricoccus deserti]|uniref:Uncharacterized protein n=1 Tax=Siccirubricoccus deserti TaxID=2013562 RepID=A0A9X0QXM9_9PROT|nr:hypothetical protein [Siccirubricoccus deserti]MBC4015112.1 hypothetical protein [Siccirubricoccus deserti]GGC38845.1 hypothetical protein GCM10011504_16600 [Siccirubricoccus deserti]
MERIMPSPFLRRVLLLDAASCLGMGLLLAVAAGPLAGWFHLPAALLRESGIVLLAFAGLLLWMATRAAVPRWLVWAVILGNALWALDSLLLLPSGWVAPNVLGGAFITAQALVVGVLATLEHAGLRRSAPVAA